MATRQSCQLAKKDKDRIVHKGCMSPNEQAENEQRALLEMNTNHVLVCISRRVASMSREEITPLCSSDLRLHLEYCAQACDN